MIACLFVSLRHKNKLFWHVNATVGGSGVICSREQKQKNGEKKYTRVQIVHIYRLLQVDVISKRENSLWNIGRKVNSLTGLSIVIFFRLIQVKSIVEDGTILDWRHSKLYENTSFLLPDVGQCPCLCRHPLDNIIIWIKLVRNIQDSASGLNRTDGGSKPLCSTPPDVGTACGHLSIYR